MRIGIEGLDQLSFEQKREVLVLLSSLISSVKQRSLDAYDSSDRETKIQLITNLIDIEPLHRQMLRSIRTIDSAPSTDFRTLVDPVLKYCEKNASPE